MTRLLVHVEGETEVTFVYEVLKPHLCTQGFTEVNPRKLGKARLQSQRGGVRSWTSARKDITNHLTEDSGRVVTTIVDYYGMPKTWPGRSEARELPFPKKAETIEKALTSDVCDQMGANFNPTRFVPYVMMHEFEAILFSDCERFAEGIGKVELASAFQGIRDEFGCPEEINDLPNTAPSKRIDSLVPGYEKVVMGTLAALEIGLGAIRYACPHFHSWRARLLA